VAGAKTSTWSANAAQQQDNCLTIFDFLRSVDLFLFWEPVDLDPEPGQCGPQLRVA
jgi:hypothetical protein